MNGTPTSTGQDRPAAAASEDRSSSAMAAYAQAQPFVLWAVEIAQTMLGMQRELMDLSRAVIRQQQDTMIASLLQDIGRGSTAVRVSSQDGFAGWARSSLEAFDRMAAALNASNDALRATTPQGPATDRAAGAR